MSYFRTGRTELAVRSQRTWRPSRAGDVDAAMQTNGLRWLLSEDGRTAIPPQDAAEIVRAWRESRVSIAVTDGGRFGSASIFDLSGRNGPRQIGGSMPLASIADRGTRLVNHRESGRRYVQGRDRFHAATKRLLSVPWSVNGQTICSDGIIKNYKNQYNKNNTIIT